MAHRPPDLLFVPAHVLPLLHPPLSLVTVHDLGYRYFPKAHPWRQRVYLDLSTRWNVRAATHLLADSQATKDDLMNHYRVPADKITVAYPGVDETLAPVRDQNTIKATKARYGITGDYFLYLGTLQPRKNLIRLVEAFAQLETPNPKPQTQNSQPKTRNPKPKTRNSKPQTPNPQPATRNPKPETPNPKPQTRNPKLETQNPKPQPQLLLAGKRGWLYDDLFKQINRLGLADRVRFPGYIAEGDKAALLSGALAFVFPSRHEGFGLPVLEAQSCGCPVITSATSSLPEVAGDGALLIDPEDTAAITAAMHRITTEPALRHTLVERGFVNVRRFSWRRCAQTALNALERCASVVR
jgi:glycosyltransferase involved in cell wall biosynthesis